MCLGRYTGLNSDRQSIPCVLLTTSAYCTLPFSKHVSYSLTLLHQAMRVIPLYQTTYKGELSQLGPRCAQGSVVWRCDEKQLFVAYVCHKRRPSKVVEFSRTVQSTTNKKPTRVNNVWKNQDISIWNPWTWIFFAYVIMFVQRVDKTQMARSLTQETEDDGTCFISRSLSAAFKASLRTKLWESSYAGYSWSMRIRSIETTEM
jgi:hypothetical protein